MSLIAGYLSEDTIVAISSGKGGAISILRISGPKAFELLEKLSHSKLVYKTETRKLRSIALYFPATSSSDSLKPQPLDQALFIKFKAPTSFTGEDVIEIYLHGGQYISERIIEILISFGARQALAGEFSFRAVRNAKINLYQAQAVMDLIGASNDQAVTLALEKLSGSQNLWIEKMSSDLRQLAALSEVGIDFSDQDVEEVSLPALKKKLKAIESSLLEAAQSYERGYRVQEGMSIAFIGLTNAGKSSFFNALLGENRSIVSEHEGTTRDLVSEKMNFRIKNQSLTVRLEDTAGLRQTEHPIEKIGIEKSLEAIQKADLLFFLLDSSGDFLAAQKQWKLLEEKSQTQLHGKVIGLLTKVDLLKTNALSNDIQEQLKKFPISQWIKSSALKKIGVQETIQAMASFYEQWTQRKAGEMILTRAEHLQALQKALTIIQRALETPEADLFAADLRQILHALNPLIGETLTDDILGKIFSDFCIGK